MRSIVTVILIVLLAGERLAAQEATAGSAIRQQIAAIPPDSLVEIRMQSGERAAWAYRESRRRGFFTRTRQRGGNANRSL